MYSAGRGQHLRLHNQSRIETYLVAHSELTHMTPEQERKNFEFYYSIQENRRD
jgi:hypothetical protein